ncbi:hypothetical protein KKF25_01095 [Patescibacteria group bacterium]|nr:hypothetical protein [Patescibacteria group bacterium]
MEQFGKETPPIPEKKESWQYQEWQAARAELDKICEEMDQAIVVASNKEERKKIEGSYSGQILDALQDERHAADIYEELLKLYRDDEE